MHVLLVGLDGAGKTTVLCKLKLVENISTLPTVGFNVETVEHKNIAFALLDVGRQEKTRQLSRHFYPDTRGLIFVVDAHDRERAAEAGQELRDLLQEDDLGDAALLVLANKQDLPGAMDASDLTDELELNRLHGRKWHVQSACATRADGLRQGLDWLADELDKPIGSYSYFRKRRK